MEGFGYLVFFGGSASVYTGGYKRSGKTISLRRRKKNQSSYSVQAPKAISDPASAAIMF